MSDGASGRYVSGRTEAHDRPIRSPKTLRRRSRQQFGRPLSEIEAGFLALIENGAVDPADAVPGRRRNPNRAPTEDRS